MSARAAAALVALLALAPAARAQTAADALARATAGDSAAAYRAARRVGDGAPDAAAARDLQLRLERAGVGLRGIPLPFRRQQTTDTARRLLRADPQSALARETLADDAVARFLAGRDRVSAVGADAVDPVEARVRMSQSRFDLGVRERLTPFLDRAAPARAAADTAAAQLRALLAAHPAHAPAYPLAAALAAGRADWAALDTLAGALARHLPASPLADLYGGLAAARQGDAARAEARFDAALARLPADERERLAGVARLLPADSAAAVAADPAGAARRFWSRTDPRRLTTAHERRAEHLARSVEADLLFGRAPTDLFSDVPRRGTDTARGRIWVRYGPPDRAVGFTQDEGGLPTYAEDGPAPYAVWEYTDADGGVRRFVFDDPGRAGLFRLYSPPAGAFARTPRAAEADDIVAQDARLRRTDPERGAPPPADLAVAPLAARFRAPDGGTEAVVVLALPDTSAAVRWGVFLGDARAAAADDGRTGVARLPVLEAGRVQAEVEAGTAAGQAALELAPLAPGAGLSDILLVASARDADDPTAGPPGPAALVRGGLVLVPLARPAAARADGLTLYVEAYGLAVRGGGTDALVEARLVPVDTRPAAGRLLGRLFGRRPPAGVAAGSELAGSRADEPVLLTLDVSGQPPGRYRLTVRLADRHAGTALEAARELEIE